MQKYRATRVNAQPHIINNNIRFKKLLLLMELVGVFGAPTSSNAMPNICANREEAVATHLRRTRKKLHRLARPQRLKATCFAQLQASASTATPKEASKPSRMSKNNLRRSPPRPRHLCGDRLSSITKCSTSTAGKCNAPFGPHLAYFKTNSGKRRRNIGSGIKAT